MTESSPGLLPEIEKNDYIPLQPIACEDYQRSGYPVSAAQKRFYLSGQSPQTHNINNLPFMVAIEGPIHREKLQEAFCRLIRRHETLRTSFMINQGVVVQRIQADLNFQLKYTKTTGGGIDEIIRKFIRPFDLSRAPLFRAELVELAKTRYQLLLDMHHSISDGFSINIFCRELIDRYAGKELPELKVQYKDFVVWENKLAHTGNFLEQENYWLNKLSGTLPILEMPLDFPRPNRQSLDGDMFKFSIALEDTARLTQLAFQWRVTLNVMLIMIYSILLSKYSGQDDLIIWTVVNGRQHPDLNNVIGTFVNMLPLRIEINHQLSVPEFIKQVSETVYEAGVNQDYPLDRLIEKLKLAGDRSRNPLMDTILVFHNQYQQDLNTEVAGIRFSGTSLRSDYAAVDLALDTALDNEGALQGSWQYAVKLFKRETIAGITGHFQQIIKTLLANPQQKLCEIEMLTPAEKQKIITEFNAAEAVSPQNKIIDRLFEEQAERTPDNIAVIFEDKRLTYGELNEKSSLLAGVLSEKGVKSNQIVAIMGERSLEMIVGIMAILKAGGTCLPVDPESSPGRIRYIMEDSAANILLIKGRLPGQVLFQGETVQLDDERLYRGDIKALGTINSPNNPAYVIYTSGSTGQPAGIMIEHYSIVNRIYWMQQQFPLDQNDIIFHTTPFSVDISVWELFWGAVVGAKVCCLIAGAENDPEQIIAAIQKNRVTTIRLAPSMLNVFLEYLEGHPGAVDGLSSLRRVFTGGETVNPRLVEKFNEILNTKHRTKLYNLYGPVETAMDVTYFDCSSGENPEKIPIGKPSGNMKLYIVDKHDKILPVGVPGELCVAGDGLARGYLNNQERTGEKFVPNPFDNLQITVNSLQLKNNYLNDLQLSQLSTAPTVNSQPSTVNCPNCQLSTVTSHRMYHTGDLARWLPDGNIEYLGGIDRQVAIKGYRIEPGGIEERPDPSTMHVRLTGNRDQNYTPTEYQVAQIWGEVLGLQEIHSGENFYNYGGNSIQALRVANYLSKQRMMEIQAVNLFQYPSLADFCRWLDHLSADPGIDRSISQAAPRDYYPVSAAQKRLYVFNQFAEPGTSYNLPVALRFHGNLDYERFTKVFQGLIQRHEAFRTSFALVDGEYVQKIHEEINFHPDCFEAKIDELDAVIDEFTRPFDLSRAPLLRVGLVKTPGDQYIILCDMHHIISDGISLGILIREFIDLYEKRELPEPRIQYKDYAVWQNELSQSPRLKRQEAYWLHTFSGELPLLNLPVDYFRPAIQSFEGDGYLIKAGRELTERIKRLAGDNNATLYMVLLAGYNVLLAKLTGQEDIIIGSPIAGRPHPDLEQCIGMFLNILAIRNYPQGRRTFQEFLAEVKANTLQAFENQDYQFDELVNHLNLKRDLSRNPLFDAYFLYQNMGFPALECKDFRLETINLNHHHAKFDISIQAYETTDGLTFDFNYRTCLFKQGTIEYMANFLIQIFEAVTHNPSPKISQIKGPPAGQNQILAEDCDDFQKMFDNGEFLDSVDN